MLVVAEKNKYLGFPFSVTVINYLQMPDPNTHSGWWAGDAALLCRENRNDSRCCTLDCKNEAERREQ